jgi:hypothetical protein
MRGHDAEIGGHDAPKYAAPSFDSRIQRTADSLKLKLAPFANRRIGGDAQGWGQPVDDSIGTLATILARSLFYA